MSCHVLIKIQTTYHYSLEPTKDYGLNISSIPRSSKENCAIKATYRPRFGVCTCNEHCSWDLCRVSDPPNDCLWGTGSEWQWDDLKNAYVAQIFTGIHVVSFNKGNPFLFV